MSDEMATDEEIVEYNKQAIKLQERLTALGTLFDWQVAICGLNFGWIEDYRVVVKRKELERFDVIARIWIGKRLARLDNQISRDMLLDVDIDVVESIAEMAGRTLASFVIRPPKEEETK